MGVEIRRAGPNDNDCLARLYSETFFLHHWTADWFAHALARPTTRCWLAHRQHQAAGFLLVQLAADEAEILSLGVTPMARRQGIAAQLLASAIAGLSSEGATVLFLEVAATNDPAQRLYRENGFTQVSRRQAYYRDGSDAIILSRLLR